MTRPSSEDKILARRRNLALRRGAILAMTPEKALERILADPQPLPLVHAFPEEDLHLLIREIGPDDALPLIAMASHRQLEYLLDQELWQRDRIDFAVTTRWLARLLRADVPSGRLIRWLAEEKTDLVELFLCRSIEVRIREHDQDPSVFGPDFFTYDSVFYIRIAALPPDGDTASPLFSDTPPQETVKRLLDHLAETDYVRFQAILLEAAHLLPAEAEEEAYRLRSGRLAEKGFLPFEEAVGLYQPLNERTFAQRARRHEIMTPEHPDSFPLVPSVVLSEDNLFARALATIEASEQRQALQEEFAALCNRIIVADRQQINQRQDLAAVVAKASGYINIGLQYRFAQTPSGLSEVAAAGGDLRRFHLEGLFRLGYNAAVQLKQTAEKWVAKSWFAGRGLPLTFWGEIGLGVIGGLLLKRPLFFDNFRGGTLYRNFASRADIEWSRRQLEQVQKFDRLLSRWHPAPGRLTAKHFLTYKNLLLTLWARHSLGLPEEVDPLPLADFVPFFKSLFRYDTTPRAKAPRKIDRAMREACLRWLSQRTQETEDRLAADIGSSLEKLFAELEENYGRVRPDQIDPHYVLHFLLEPRHPHPR